MRQTTVEFVEFPSIFVFAEALTSFTRGMDSEGASMIDDSRGGIQRGAKSVISRDLIRDPRESA